jgi:uncharacterized membrane protein
VGQYGSVPRPQSFHHRTSFEAASRRTRGHHVEVLGLARTAAVVLASLLGVAVLAGLVALWPSGDVTRLDTAPWGSTTERGVVDDVTRTECTIGTRGPEATGTESPSPTGRCGLADIVLITGPERGQTYTVALTPDVMDVGLSDRVVLERTLVMGLPSYQLKDGYRGLALGLLALLFGGVVLAVARGRGARALAALAVAAGVVWWFVLPSLLLGEDAVPVGLTAAGVVLLVALYLTHGISVRTTTALLGGAVGLAVTAALAWWTVRAAHLADVGDGGWGPSPPWQKVPGLTLKDVLVCAAVVGAVGVVADLAHRQATAVWDLRACSPLSSRRAVFAHAMRAGRGHVASALPTIGFAYAGASLAVLLLVSLEARPVGFTLTGVELGELAVLIMAGAIGVVLAVPLTTALPAWAVPAAPASSGVVPQDRLPEMSRSRHGRLR